jgi:hypothetical protein
MITPAHEQGRTQARRILLRSALIGAAITCLLAYGIYAP